MKAINHLEEAYLSNNPYDLGDYLEVTPTKEVRTDITNLLHKYADVGFLVEMRDHLSTFIERRDRFEELTL